MLRTPLLFAVLALGTVSGSLAAQTRHVLLDQARDFYDSAAYEQALSLLDGLATTTASDAATVEQYRAACLLALGRNNEAEQAFEKLVTLAPDLQPDELEMAPWITSIFADVRARVLSRLEQQRQVQNQEQPAFHTIDDVAVSRPIPLRERIPEPPPLKGVDFTGIVILQIDIDTDGSVERVILDGAIHPVYDAMIREAARTWRYRPATLNAEPVKFRKALKIEIS